MPFHRPRQKTQHTHAALVVQALESGRTPQTVIDHRFCKHAEERVWSVDSPSPESVPPRIEFVGVLALEQRLRHAIAHLLAPVGSYRGASIVPYQRRRAVANPMPPFKNAPANVHIVAGCPVSYIESANLFQNPL